MPNVYAKLGGLAMPVNGWDWHKRELPVTSDELLAKHENITSLQLRYLQTDACSKVIFL